MIGGDGWGNVLLVVRGLFIPFLYRHTDIATVENSVFRVPILRILCGFLKPC